MTETTSDKRQKVSPTTSWIVTDGKAGDELQCLGVAEALGLEPDIRRVKPRKRWAWMMPRGPIDPAEGPERPSSPLTPPWPDIAIASGRRAVPYLRAIKRLSGNQTFTVFLKNPRTGTKAADFIWVPEHDSLRGENVLVTLTSPHRISQGRLDKARQAPLPAIQDLPGPRVAVLVGGNSAHHRYGRNDHIRLLARLDHLVADGAHLMITMSRRTPDDLAAQIRSHYATSGHIVWGGAGPNPYIQFLAHADGIVVTADSVNMVGEATITGKPVMVFHPQGGARKIDYFLNALAARGITRLFEGKLETYTYTPLDSTPEIAKAIATAYDQYHMRQNRA